MALSFATMSDNLSTKRKGARCGRSILIRSTSSTTLSCPASPIVVSFRLLRELRERVDLAHPFLHRLGRYAAIILASGKVLSGGHGGARGKPGSVSDAAVIADTDLSAQHHVVANLAAARNA